ncbi:hypothetical protein ATH84_1001167 [Paracoccus versutus]|uniref:Uncharacterized protein n=1 Tax=Paracoccus versutus TaxID=34007 RepID=A0AAQ0HNK8_PARVE|nr:hypothetical protein ATH84_1001167 [Paracoccus versutus]
MIRTRSRAILAEEPEPRPTAVLQVFAGRQTCGLALIPALRGCLSRNIGLQEAHADPYAAGVENDSVLAVNRRGIRYQEGDMLSGRQNSCAGRQKRAMPMAGSFAGWPGSTARMSARRCASERRRPNRVISAQRTFQAQFSLAATHPQGSPEIARKCVALSRIRPMLAIRRVSINSRRWTPQPMRKAPLNAAEASKFASRPAVRGMREAARPARPAGADERWEHSRWQAKARTGVPMAHALRAPERACVTWRQREGPEGTTGSHERDTRTLCHG